MDLVLFKQLKNNWKKNDIKTGNPKCLYVTDSKCIESIYLIYQMRLALGFLLLHGHLGNKKNAQNFNRTGKIIFCLVSVTCHHQEYG